MGPCADTSSSLDHSSQSDSFCSEISLNTSYAPAYKKRKTGQKVEAVISSMEAACLGQGEQLGDVIACSCLFKRKINYDGKEIIWHVFSEVASELGVRKAFDELIPDELWMQRVHRMSVPDWLLLLCKQECKISDDAWQMILNRKKLGKSGVSFAVNEFSFIFIANIVRYSYLLPSKRLPTPLTTTYPAPPQTPGTGRSNLCSSGIPRNPGMGCRGWRQCK